MKMHPVQSSNLAAVGFENGELIVQFKSGKRYQYRATKEEFEMLLKAKSVGSYFSSVIRSRPALALEDEE